MGRGRDAKGMGHFFHSLGTSNVRTSDRNAKHVTELLRQRGGEVRESQN
jgi:hypothetical protein